MTILAAPNYNLANETVKTLSGVARIQFSINRPADMEIVLQVPIAGGMTGATQPQIIGYCYKAENWAQYIAILGADYATGNLQSTINGLATQNERNTFFNTIIAPILASKLLKKLALKFKRNSTVIADVIADWELNTSFTNGQINVANLRVRTTGLIPPTFTFGEIEFELTVDSTMAWAIDASLVSIVVKEVSLQAETENYPLRSIVEQQAVNYTVSSGAVGNTLVKQAVPAVGVWAAR